MNQAKISLFSICCFLLLFTTANVNADGAWKYSINHDAMRNMTQHEAQLKSSNKQKFQFPYNGGSNLFLVLGEKNGKYLELIVIQKGQFNCSSDGCYVNIKFDEDEILKFNASPSSDGSHDTLIITSLYRDVYADQNESADQLLEKQKTAENAFLKRLTTSKHLIIEASFFQEGIRQFSFNTSGLRWPPK